MTPDLRIVAHADPVQLQAATWFARLRADDLTDGETRRWRAWMEDPQHRRAFERLEHLWSDVGEFAPHREIAMRIDSIPTAADSGAAALPSRRKGQRWYGVAAGAAMAALVGTWLLLRPAVPAQLEYGTAVGEHRSVMLEDGSRVTLDTDTQLSVAYSDIERRLTLTKGRALFRVANEVRPLTVHTSHGGVRAVGTEFEVYRRDRDVEVALIEGEVLLLPAGNDGTAAPAPVKMVAGHKARYSSQTPIPQIEPLQMASAAAWLSGQLVFEDVALPEVAAEFNRYSHDQIELGSGLSGVRVTGVFHSDGLLSFVGALADAYPIRVDVSNPGVVQLEHKPTGSRPADGTTAGRPAPPSSPGG